MKAFQSPDTKALVDKLVEASAAYYAGAPLMDDAPFDSLEAELRRREPGHWFLGMVGAPVPVDGAWPKHVHEVPMGSLAKAQKLDELEAWWKGIGSPVLLQTEKLDGFSISLRYENGLMVRAVTRGDGVAGENITRNVLRMLGVPRLKKFSGHVRGEIVCLRSSFAAFFKGVHSNPRNTAAGIARRHDGKDAEKLTLIAYQILPDDVLWQMRSKSQELNALKQSGFVVPRWMMVGDMATAKARYDQYADTLREKIDYDIDGLVFEVEDGKLALDLGESSGRPKGSRAFKFPHDKAETTLTNVVWQVGPSGRVTPVAEFEPVSLAGAEVARASLHNISNIDRLWLEQDAAPAEGDRIVVSRRNDVIPYVEALMAAADEPTRTFPTPAGCPVCAGVLVREGEYLLCRNMDCSAQVAGLITTWINELGVLHFGESLVTILVGEGLVKDAADLYTVDVDAVEELVVDGKKVGGTATRAFKNLHAQTVIPPATFMAGLGITGWGKALFTKLVDAGLRDPAQMPTLALLLDVEGVGAAKAAVLLAGWKKRLGLIQRLLTHVTIKGVASGALTGSSFCFTGFRDKTLEKALEACGATIKTSVGKQLTYLVAADPNAGSEKVTKAKQNGTKVISKIDAEEMTR